MTALLGWIDNPNEAAQLQAARRVRETREAERQAELYELHQDIEVAYADAIEAERLSTRLKASTLSFYRRDIARLETFCERHGFPMRREAGALQDSVRPELLVKFLYEICTNAIEAGKPIPYRRIVRTISAISHLHKLSRYQNPLGVLVDPTDHLFVRGFLRHLSDVRQAIPGEQPPVEPARVNGNGHEASK